VVFIFWACWHNWTAFFCAELCDCSIQHVYLVKEIYSWNKEIYIVQRAGVWTRLFLSSINADNTTVPVL
jgi:hypothetical protein